MLAYFLSLAGEALTFAGEAPSQSEEPLQPYFTDVTDEVGLTATPGFRLSTADVNGDGYPDILLHEQLNHGTGDVKNKQYLYLNVQGDMPSDPYSRKFIDYTTESGIRANRQSTPDGRHSDSAIFADVDNDGDLDMFTLVYIHSNYTINEGTNDLMLNDGEAHFTLAPNSPFHNEPIYNTAAAVFVEYDNDGYVDLYIGNWYGPGSTLTVDQLYQGHGDGSFTNVTSAAGINAASTCIYGIAAWDWNDDGYTDLFAPPYAWTVWDSVPIHWRNNGNGTFTQVQDTSNYDQDRGTLSTVASFGSMPRDYDNDGDMDFYEILVHGAQSKGVWSTVVTNVDQVYSWDYAKILDRGLEDQDMTHHGDHYASWFDFDNDSLVDFILSECCYDYDGTHDNNQVFLFKQASDNTFSPVTEGSGLDYIGDNWLRVHNVLPMDYDLDGDDDVLIGFANNSNGIQMWRNDIGTNNNWITISLEGAGIPGKSNRSAIGARVEVTAGGVTQTQEVYAGPGHHGPQVPLNRAFGLGSSSIVDSITVYWPNQDQKTTTLTDVAINQFLAIIEPCPLADDPINLMLEKDGEDIVLTWDDPAVLELTWNVYRDESSDPSEWGSVYAAGITDQDPGTPGIQYRDVGAVSTGASYHYLVTAVNECGESPLR
jgi:hypothetical protein